MRGIEGDEILQFLFCFLPEGGVVEAGLSDEEFLAMSGGVGFEVVIVKRLSAVKEAEFKDEVFRIEAEVLLDEGLGVSSSEAFLGGEAQFLQSLHPEGEVLNISRAPHNHLIFIPSSPELLGGERRESLR